jgi:NTE family protein
MKTVTPQGIRLVSALVLSALLVGCATAPPPVPGQATAPSQTVTPWPFPGTGPVVPSVPTPPHTEKRLAHIGLALGGGAARGFAHVGVIQALEEAGIRPELVTGTSAGSLVAALYASGKNSAQLKKVADSMEEAEITDWMIPILNRGALRGEALARYVNTQVGGLAIEQMKLPLGIVATDLQSGEPMLFRRGSTGTAVRASSAVPGVFQPVRLGSREYVDGGLVAPVPVMQAREMGANFVIAVDISSDPEGNLASDTFQILMQTFTIMGKSINSYGLKDANLVVRPALTGVKSADFTARRRSIEAGHAAMQKLIPRLRELLAQFENAR